MMPRPFDVVVVGELNIDLILRGDVTPVFGQVEKLVDHAALTIGSSSAIFACGAARLGLKVAFIGKVGRDTLGKFMVDALHGYGINTAGVIVDPAVQTGLSVILAHDDAPGGPRAAGDRAILTHPGGSIASLIFDEVNREILTSARHLHYASYFLQAALRPGAPALFETARRAGLTISMDTNYDPDECWDDGLLALLPLVDVFLPNETEIQAISGADDLDVALDWFAHRVPLTAVKLGAKGAQARRGTQTWRAAPLSVNVVDTVGAGDSFDAGFVYGWLAGWDPGECLKLANTCGALSTRAAGGTAAQPTLEEARNWV